MSKKGISKKQNTRSTSQAEVTWHDHLIFYSLLLIAFALPLLILPRTADIFELPKVTLLRLWVPFVLMVWSIKVYQTGKLSFRRTALDVPVVLLGLVAVVSTVLSVNLTISLVGGYYRYEGLFTILAYLAVFFITTQFLRLERLNLLIYALLASAGINAVYGIFQHYGYDFIKLSGKVFELTRSSGALGNPVFLGALLVSTISLPLAKFFAGRNWTSRVLFFFIFLLFAVSLVFTSTRAAWLGLGVLLVVVALLFPRRAGLRYAAPIAILVVLAAVLVFLFSRVYFPGAGTIAARAFSMFQPKGSAATRLDMWKGSLKLIRDRPLLGSGWENFEGTFPRYGTKFLMSQEELPDRPHNQLLYVATSAGLWGLLAYLWLIIGVYFLAFRYVLSLGSLSGKRVWVVAALAGVTGYVVQEQFSISTAGVTPIFWLFLGVIARQSAEDKQLAPKQIGFALRSLFLFAAGVIFLVGSTVNLQFFYADVLYREAADAGSLTEREAALQRAVGLNSYIGKYRSALARVYAEEAFQTQNSQKLGEAIALYEEGLRMNPRDEGMWIELGDLYSSQGDRAGLEKAMQAYKQVLVLHPLSAGARWALGDLYLAHGDYKAAISYLEAASSLVPTHTGILSSLAVAYLKAGKTGQARNIYLKIQELEPGNAKIKRALEALSGK